MTNKSSTRSPGRIRNKVRFSIVWKLNTKLFFRLFGIFLNLNICLLVLSAAGLFVYAEQTVGATAEKLTQAGTPPPPEMENWLDLTPIRIDPIAGEPEGFHIPPGLQAYLSPLTANQVRSIDLPHGAGQGIWERIQKASYNVTFQTDNGSYLLSFRPESTIRILVALFGIMFLIEGIILLSSISSGARVIRHTLQPIEQLAETARSLSHEGIFSPEQLKDLAGKLDHINATRLDTRISMDETQSELQSLAQAINSMLDRINESYRSQVRFVSDASHELRTPISVIQGYANLLDRWGKKDEKTLQESIDAIKNETAHMKALVEQLLFLARGDNNTMALQAESFELSSLAHEILRETQMIDGGHEYSSALTPVYIKGDKGLIKQATRILMDNAMKYTPAGKQITLSVSSKGNFARLTVQDEGIGIEPEAVPLIFDRFFRTDESRTRTTGGSGLGLSIAKWITERHGGHLEVLSRQDIGTRISLVLPLVPEGEAQKD
ncbi:signal transduction histidine kinase [Desulfitobacterium dehalogenans ATCC 51507]|uniref:histidine kinase n=1 Tax=Desulfitobacterium dehalogenans (strain ATCC 51507 / DSM 9161 / JW/IU-DC1) TaxID=756499 RepID=I4A888_DESDJ|nr:HAMP domain-containing sensor histidine kinase [Desulfitobacterium dehalogenans]AFM00173.1 signal transduction histidine kinase [Desulfitobacterium dehalogenans ATCC 51507]